MAMTFKPEKTYLTVRELIAELSKLPEEDLDAAVVTSKLSLETKTFELDAVTEIVTGTKAGVSPSGFLRDPLDEDEEQVRTVVLY